MCVAAPRSWSPPGSGWCRARPSQPHFRSWELVAHPRARAVVQTSPCPNFKAAGMRLKLHAWLGRGDGVLEGRSAHPLGASKAPGAWQTQESGACPRKLSGSGNLMDGSGVSLDPHIQEPPQRVQCFLLLVGSRPDREVRQGRGSGQKPRSVSRLLQAPRPSNPRLPRREATLPPTRRGHSPGVGGYSSSFGLNNHGSLGDLCFRTLNCG